MKKAFKSRVKFLLICLIILGSIPGVAALVTSKDKPQEELAVVKPPASYLSAEEIRQAFECDRITLEIRETDVFCGHPKFYNSPDSVTIEDYFNYLDCSERLKNPPDLKSDIRQYYDMCKDPNKLKPEQLKFIQRLKDIKKNWL